MHSFTFIFDTTLKRVRFKKDSVKIKSILLCDKLKYMMGFDRHDFYEDKVIAKYIPDLKNGFYSLYVYCDMVEPQIIGNVTAPLLRNVHIDGSHGEIIEKLFNSPLLCSSDNQGN